tara:strand:- start:899 stop:1117 length:219 start_codon:yes stop_codon:yes gene_type:complete
MTFFSDLTDGLAFIISPGAYLINKKAEEGKLGDTAKKAGQGFVQGATLGKMNGRRKMNGNGKKKIKPVNKKK